MASSLFKSVHADKGKWTEGKIEVWLESRSRSIAPFAWHRFTDTRAARNMVARQPSDYLVVASGSTTFLEAKETAQEYRFPKDKLSQYGKLLMFHLAGARPIVLIYRSLYSDWTYLTATELFGHDVAPKSFPWEGRPSFQTEGQALLEIFQ